MTLCLYVVALSGVAAALMLGWWALLAPARGAPTEWWLVRAGTVAALVYALGVCVLLVHALLRLLAEYHAASLP